MRCAWEISGVIPRTVSNNAKRVGIFKFMFSREDGSNLQPILTNLNTFPSERILAGNSDPFVCDAECPIVDG
jgi:hypothetical protein